MRLPAFFLCAQLPLWAAAIPIHFVEQAPGHWVADSRGARVAAHAGVLTLSDVASRVVLRPIEARLAEFGPAEAVFGVTRAGARPGRWRASQAVRAEALWPGVSMVVHGVSGNLEYDFHVSPGADPARIRLRVEGADPRALDEGLSLGRWRQKSPRCWTETPTGRRDLPCHTVLDGAELSFRVEGWPGDTPLVIDPELIWSTYFAGPLAGDTQGGYSTDRVMDVESDAEGNVYLTGNISFTDFYRTPGVYQETPVQNGGLYVAKLDPAANRLLWITYYGTGHWIKPEARSMAVTRNGEVWVGGSGPAELGAPVPSLLPPAPTNQGQGFIFKLSSDGARLLVSTNAGGSVSQILLDAEERLLVTGSTPLSHFPLLGGGPSRPGDDHDLFLARLLADGTAYDWTFRYGGSSADGGIAMAIDSAGWVYVTGATASPDFPSTIEAIRPCPRSIPNDSAILVQVRPGSANLGFATCVGGASGSSVTLAPDGGVAVAGYTRNKSDVIVTPGTLDENLPAWSGTGMFLAVLSPAATELRLGLYTQTVHPSRRGLAYLDWGGIAVAGALPANIPAGSDDALMPVPGYSTPGQYPMIGWQILSADGVQILHRSAFGGLYNNSLEAVRFLPGSGLLLGGSTTGVGFPTTNGVLQPVGPLHLPLLGAGVISSEGMVLKVELGGGSVRPSFIRIYGITPGQPVRTGTLRLKPFTGESRAVLAARCEGGWLTLARTVVDAPAEVEWSASPAGLAPGVHHGVIEVVSGAALRPFRIPVTFEIGALRAPTLITLRPGEVATLPVAGGTSVHFHVHAAAGWLRIDRRQGLTPDNLELSIDDSDGVPPAGTETTVAVWPDGSPGEAVQIVVRVVARVSTEDGA